MDLHTQFVLFLLGISLCIWLILRWVFQRFFLGKFKNNATVAATYCLALSMILLWASIYFIETPLEPFTPENLHNHVAKGGFPLTCFYYPMAAMGGHAPPMEQWPLFLFNFFFWSGLAVLVFSRLSEESMALFSHKLVISVVVFCTFVLNFYFILLLRLWFD